MNGENQPLVRDEPVEYEKSPVELKTSWELPIILEEFKEYKSK